MATPSDEQKLTAIQQDVVAYFKSVGRATDRELVTALGAKYGPSTIRTRRAELVRLGLIRKSGEALINNRRTAVWEYPRAFEEED